MLTGITISSLSQTNQINHYSHSGSPSTLKILKARDNMGLGCGSAMRNEFTPSIDTNTVIWDSIKADSNKVCTPNSPSSTIKSINPKQDTSKVYNRGPK